MNSYNKSWAAAWHWAVLRTGDRNSEQIRRVNGLREIAKKEREDKRMNEGVGE